MVFCLVVSGCAAPPFAGEGASGFWITVWWPSATGALALLFGAFCALWAQNTGRNPWLWFFLGVMFHVIAVVVLPGMPGIAVAMGKGRPVGNNEDELLVRRQIWMLPMQYISESVPMDSVAAGDVIELATDVKVGDIVVLVRLTPRRLVLRAVSPSEAAAYVGPKYRAMKGNAPGTVSYQPMEETALKSQGEQPKKKPWWMPW